MYGDSKKSSQKILYFLQNITELFLRSQKVKAIRPHLADKKMFICSENR